MTDTQHEAAERVSESTTNRGFSIVTFEDFNGIECTLQKSSIATQDCIWLGAKEIGLKRFVPYQGGWKDVPTPSSVDGESHIANNRMHLSREQVEMLLPILQNFVATGAVSSALRAHDAGQAGVVVKPLEWVKHPTAAMWRCDTIVGLYQVAAIVEPASWTFDGLPGQSAEGSASGSGEAMAAAFEHYRSAILPALASPQPPAPTGSLFGDALAAAGQSIGMSVTRVHPEPEKVGEAKRWLIEEKLPNGTIRWQCVEHEHHARSIAQSAEYPATVTPLFAPATPPVADARRVEKLERALEQAKQDLLELAGSEEHLAPAVERIEQALKGDSNGQ